MKDKLLLLLSCLLALMRTPPDEAKSIKSQKKNIKLLRDEINTFHGDDDIASEEASELIDDLIEVGASSQPDDEYSEVPKIEPDAEDEDEAEAEAEPDKPEADAEDEDEEPDPVKVKANVTAAVANKKHGEYGVDWVYESPIKDRAMRKQLEQD